MDAITLLERAGFAQTTDNATVTYGDTSVFVTDAATGKAPTPETKLFRAVLPRVGEPSSKYFDIALESTDVRDIVAFASAAEGDSLVHQGDQARDERVFEYEGTAIHNAFADPQYGDWQGTHVVDWPHNADGRAVLVTHPDNREWANAYREWRDGYCDSLLQAPAPGI